MPKTICLKAYIMSFRRFAVFRRKDNTDGEQKSSTPNLLILK